MDPVNVLTIATTAASTARAAWDVGEWLYVFFRDLKALDSTVSGLVGEAKALSGACALVDERLRDIVQDFEAEIRQPRANRRRLWACIEVQVTESQKSVAQLQAAYQKVQRDRSNNISQVWRQIKLNMQAKDIDEARNRIRSHTMSLQIILQTVAIEVYYLTPRRADQQLRALLSGVEECMFQLKALRQERIETSLTNQINEANILEISEDTVSSGESLYAASVANGSISGAQDSQLKVAKIEQLMADLTAIEETVSLSSDNGVNVHPSDTTPEASSPGIGEYMILRQSHDSAYGIDYDDKPSANPWPNDIEADSDDELLIELAQEALAAARIAFRGKDYQEASSYLQEALKMVRELPARHQGICDTWDTRYMLSVCAYHSQRPIDAEAQLLGIIDHSSRSNNASKEQLRQVCEAGHLLSQLYVRLGNLDHARLYCDNALHGRRRLLGKAHDETYQSLALMARIHRLLGCDIRAKVYLRLIHEGKREEFEHIYAKLAFSDDVSEEYKLSQLSSQAVETDENARQASRSEANKLSSPQHAENARIEDPPQSSVNYVAREEAKWPELPLRDPVPTAKPPKPLQRAVAAKPTPTPAVNRLMRVDSKAASQAPNFSCIIVLHTDMGEFHMGVKTNLQVTTPTFDPSSWRYFSSRVLSGRYDDERIYREGPLSNGILKIWLTGEVRARINLATMDFVMERKTAPSFRVAGTVLLVNNVINAIHTYSKPGKLRGKTVEIRRWDIRGGT